MREISVEQEALEIIVQLVKVGNYSMIGGVARRALLANHPDQEYVKDWLAHHYPDLPRVKRHG